MADEIIGELDEEPDTSDVEMLIVNVETREGQQLSRVWSRQEGKLSMSTDGYETDGVGFTKWTFTITHTTP